MAILTCSCGTQEDLRVFSPMVNFESADYIAAAEEGGIDIALVLSHPAQTDFNVGLNIITTLEEGRQFNVSSKKLEIKKGEQSAPVRISFAEDEIWDEESLIKLSLLPGERYTVNPDGNCEAYVKLTKTITLPAISIDKGEDSRVTNPYLAETLHLTLSSKKAPSEDLQVALSFSDLEAGRDYLIDGRSETCVTFPAGQNSVDFELKILQRDESGMDEVHSLRVESEKGSYVEAGEPVEIRFYDPVVNLDVLMKTAALNNGEGHQMRQAIKSADGSWNGNTAVDMARSAEGSNYLSSKRNLFLSQWLCKVVSPGSNALRLTEFFPAFQYPQPLTIADYGSAGNTRNFSACDSLFRFTLDKDSSTKGSISNLKPRSFHCYIAEREVWDEGSNPSKAWQLDSKLTDGIIDASSSEMFKERIEVSVERVEGRFDLENSSETILVTVWLKSDSPYFMEGLDFERYAAVKDGDCWKLEYKIWPR